MEDFKFNIQGNNSWQALRMISDLVSGYDTMSMIGEGITFFGSARINNGEHYDLIEKIAYETAKRGYNVITGGGPGIMEAANKGAYSYISTLSDDEKQLAPKSCGIGVELPFEASNNDYITPKHNLTLKYFFIRKMLLMNFSSKFIIGHGGFGTLDELFEVITLQQTTKLNKKPIYLVGSDYWGGLIDWIKNTLLDKHSTIKKEDLDNIKIVDTVEEIFD